MTQEDKELLLKDLCARIPYRVKMNHVADDEHSPKTLIGVAKNMITLEGLGGYECVDIENYKPYLYPLSSMTEEQRREYTRAQSDDGDIVFSRAIKYVETGVDIVSAEYHATDYLIAHHFDYRGLIPMGLALDATGLNIY